jgi:hypothetical protein
MARSGTGIAFLWGGFTSLQTGSDQQMPPSVASDKE